jgi:hypothetical protein
MNRSSVEAALSWPFSKRKDPEAEWLRQTPMQPLLSSGERSETNPKNFTERCENWFKNLKSKMRRKKRNTITKFETVSTQTEHHLSSSFSTRPALGDFDVKDLMGSTYHTEMLNHEPSLL